jgi:hypothetical protein
MEDTVCRDCGAYWACECSPSPERAALIYLPPNQDDTWHVSVWMRQIMSEAILAYRERKAHIAAHQQAEPARPLGR